MSNFIVDPKSVSYVEIRQQLINYFNSLPDAASWAIFLASSAGARIIDLQAAMMSFNKLDSITARREGFIQFAKNRSSIIGKAQDFGYSSYRGRNKVIKLTVTPAASGVWLKYTALGSVKDKFLILEKNTVVNAGVPIQVNVIIGEVLTETINSTGVILNSFRFHSPDVSQDLRMYIDGIEIEWGSEINDALDGKFQVQSNTFRSVDAKYLNLTTFPVQYIIGSPIMLEYIVLKDLVYTNTDLKFYDAFGVFSAIEDVSLFSDVETDESIRINAPIKNETSNAVRGREDQPKIFRTLHPDIIDAAGIDIIAAVMKIYLLRSLGYTYSAAEFSQMQSDFTKYRPNGLYPPLLENALPANIKFKIELTLKPNSTTVPSTLVDSVLLPYKNKQGASILLQDLENSLEDDAGVKIARVSVKAAPWVTLKNYKLGDYVEPTITNGFVYRIFQIKSMSDTVEPTWPLVAGNTVIDKQIVWKAIAKNDLAGITNWAASTFYHAGELFNVGLGSVVKPTLVNGFVYEAVDELHLSGAVEPTWTAVLGDTFEDGRLLWVVRPILGTPTAWTANADHNVGDIVKATVGLLTVMFQCVNYLDKSSAVEPTWPLVSALTVGENNLLWETFDKLQNQHSVNNSQYFIIANETTVL